MISQKFPVADTKAGAERSRAAKAPAWEPASATEVSVEQGVTGRNGSVRRELHLAPRCKGTRLGPGLLPRGAGARWLRRTLLLPGAGSAGGGRRRQRAALRNRDADCELPALFGRAGHALARALWHERDPESPPGRPRDPVGYPQDP